MEGLRNHQDLHLEVHDAVTKVKLLLVSSLRRATLTNAVALTGISSAHRESPPTQFTHEFSKKSLITSQGVIVMI